MIPITKHFEIINEMKYYINSIEESKDYYISLSIEYAHLFDINMTCFVFLSCVIDRAMNINRGFITLTKDNNYACAIPLMRMMIDNCLRLWGITIVDDAQMYIKQWSNGEKISDLRDKSGKKLTDSYLSEKFSNYYQGIDKTYKDACRFVHFSEQSLYMTAKKGDSERTISLEINGYDSFSEEVKQNINKWMLYFNNILIDLIRNIFTFNFVC